APRGSARCHDMRTRATGGRRRRWPAVLLCPFVLLAGGLLAATLVAPSLIRKRIDERLMKVEGHAGSLGGVELRLDRGGIVLRDPQPWPKGTALPTLRVPKIEAALNLKRLVTELSVVAKVAVDDPEVFIREDEFTPREKQEEKAPAPPVTIAIEQAV